MPTSRRGRSWRPGPGVLVLVALAVSPAAPELAAAQAPPGGDLVAKGKYVFGAAGGCGCHTEPKGPVNAGGRRFDGPFGSVYSSNITPDRQHGIGAWTDAEIITAIR